MIFEAYTNLHFISPFNFNIAHNQIAEKGMKVSYAC